MRGIPAVAWVVALITAGVIVITLITKNAPSYTTPSFTIGPSTLTAGGNSVLPTGMYYDNWSGNAASSAASLLTPSTGLITPALNPYANVLGTPSTDVLT